jgi:FKBP-type peptidyl-prolyl cis-trans isomerase SlyD
MANTKLTVADGMVVSLDYTLRLDDGEEIDASTEQEPLEFLQGLGEIIPGLEQALYGMGIGEEKEVVVSPEEGYGDIDPEAFEEVPRNVFPDDLKLEPGMELHMRDADSGEQFEAYVSEVRRSSVLLDFNHPLAGETLHFRVKIAMLRPATHEELAHGHVHDEDGIEA